jgi:hypothetical protein
MRFAIPSGIKPQTLLFFEKAYNWPARETCWKLELALGWREGSILEFRELVRGARNLVIDTDLLRQITAPVPEVGTDGRFID